MIILYSLLGLLTGAFLNLAADELPQRRPLGSPRCPYCGQNHLPPEWIAVFSFLLLRGRCQHCQAPLSLRRPLLELGTMLAFAFLWQRYGPTPLLLLFTFYICILFLVLVIDLEHRLILNVVILPAILMAGIGSSLSPDPGPLRALAGGLIGFASFYLIALARKGGMGAGDVKLAAFIGLATGFPSVFVALLIAILAGGATALVLVLTRVKGLKSYIPYGPFLVIGGLVALIYGPQIVAWYLRLYH